MKSGCLFWFLVLSDLRGDNKAGVSTTCQLAGACVGKRTGGGGQREVDTPVILGALAIEGCDAMAARPDPAGEEGCLQTLGFDASARARVCNIGRRSTPPGG